MFFSFLLILSPHFTSLFFFFNDTATTEIYTLSLHDALPISETVQVFPVTPNANLDSWLSKSYSLSALAACYAIFAWHWRSEEHTSELQSPDHLVCRLLLEKKKKNNKIAGLGSKERLSIVCQT